MILQIIETLGLGGAERLLATNMKFIDKERFENIVVSIYSDKDSEIIYEALDGIKIEKIFPIFKHDVFTISRRLFNIIKKYKIDIIHTHAPISDIYGRIIGRLAGCRVLTTIHNANYEIAQSEKRLSVRVKLFLIQAIDRVTGKFCVDKFIAVSKFVKQYAVKHSGYPIKNMHVLYNAVDTDYFNTVDPNIILTERKKLGINGDEKIILTIGRNVPQKGQKCIIEAFKYLVSKNNYGIKLVIVGIGPLRGQLELHRDRLGLNDHVIFVNPQRDIRALLGMCDVFVFTSYYEGLGIAQIEAMAMRRPVVAFETGPISEAIEDKVNGILVRSRDSKKLSEAIEVILNNPELGVNMGLEGRRITKERFNIYKNIKVLENIYLDIFNSRKGNLA
jgi:glycosyltransferase involved in cell wall biosynthesis